MYRKNHGHGGAKAPHEHVPPPKGLEHILRPYPAFRLPNSRKDGANRGPRYTLGYHYTALRAGA